MKRIANTQRAATDDIYRVSAADIADKLIDRMRRGLDPLLFASSSLDLLPVAQLSRSHLGHKFD
jgi:hypothetical protein